MSATVHASVARVNGRGVLIRGRSGSGKSSLLLALLTSRDVDAILVADDRILLDVVGDRVVATVPATIAGMMEIRGVGIVRRPFANTTPLDLVVDLLPLPDCPRMPNAKEVGEVFGGVSVPRIFIAIGATDGVARVTAALAHSTTDILS